VGNVIDIQAEPAPESQALVLRQRAQEEAVGLFGTNEPVAVIEKAGKVASALKAVIVKQGLVSKISGKEYPRCEAWTLLGTMLGVFPINIWTRKVDGGWEARVEARTKDGAVIGAAEAQCLKSEKNWSNREDFALRSMAQTRATAKCLRMPLGFVMTLAGFEATPAEEMGQASAAKPTGHPPAAVPAPRSSGPPAPKPSPAIREPKPAMFADESTRARMIAGLKEFEESLLLDYFRKLNNPAVLMPKEGLLDVPLQYVPVTKRQFAALREAIVNFGNGDEAKHAFPANPLAPGTLAPGPESPVIPTSSPKPAAPSVRSVPRETQVPLSAQVASQKDPEWWREVIVPVPPKGVKRNDYMQTPDTIGSLYTRMKEGDQEAGRRLFGFVNHYDPKPWIGRDGKERPPSDVDTAFRLALDAFAEWHEKNGLDTVPEENAEEDFPY